MTRATLTVTDTPKGRTLTLGGVVVAGPGGEARVAAQFDVDLDALAQALVSARPGRKRRPRPAPPADDRQGALL